MGKSMSDEEAAKRTTIYRVDNVPFRSDTEVLEWVHRVFDQRTKYGFQPL
jgi:methyl-coenzyme M reductase gamma subunit